ncbi:hypothetical protein EJ04DRAFT_606555 [Polyplosphaeria fusca]|uniref:Uncharacterized protein n=1 Tax=Polyplosphaeria fusca TaxID=682080 RepID=A0A9P4UYF3_9PLEO|nr:hypothetical protein EJ04DRAFT_606555 [Polyplosphaeria fusca]
MAAPSEKTAADMNGRWRLNKGLSGNTNELMTLQGVSWIMKKAISLADIIICITQRGTGAETVVVLENTANFGLRGTTETRLLNWISTSHKDPIWGHVHGRSKFLSAGEAAQEASLTGLFQHFGMSAQDIIYSEAEAADGTWKSQMLWGFELIEGTRYFVRNTRVCRGSKQATAQIVYDYIP